MEFDVLLGIGTEPEKSVLSCELLASSVSPLSVWCSWLLILALVFTPRPISWIWILVILRSRRIGELDDLAMGFLGRLSDESSFKFWFFKPAIPIWGNLPISAVPYPVVLEVFNYQWITTNCHTFFFIFWRHCEYQFRTQCLEKYNIRG